MYCIYTCRYSQVVKPTLVTSEAHACDVEFSVGNETCWVPWKANNPHFKKLIWHKIQA